MNNNILSQFSLTEKEIEAIKNRLKREPNELEIAMFDAEWSEHCSYKSSKNILKQLPTEGKNVLLGPGFDAGIIDAGNGNVITIHVESHNHPSAIDPYGGAATGVGGILRDIISVGTRPIALLNALRFGEFETSNRSKWLFKQVVKGIGDYGNCVGIPTVGGEVQFDSSFERNCLVDVICIGYGKENEIVLGEAKNVSDLIIIVGGKTGRDGIQGASFSSQNLGVENEEDRAAVQIPEPFTKKQILEATLESVKTGNITGVKDLGGGGLTCGLSEIGDKGGTGIQMQIEKVPVRDSNMSSMEIMISESQERMLFIVKQGYENEIFKIFDKYDLIYSIIGKVTKDKQLVIKDEEKIIAKLPISFLANAPEIFHKSKKPEYIKLMEKFEKPNQPNNLGKVLLKLISSPNISSKKWVYEQYDHEVGASTVIKPGKSGAAVLRLPNNRYLALKADGNSKHCYIDPYNGSAGILAESCRNILSVGAKPIAMVDHLQFGNPNDPEVFWSFTESVKGMADYCKAIELPCVGGKVSFYNEDEIENKAIKPSPLSSVIGFIDDPLKIRSLLSQKKSNIILSIGITNEELGGSEYYEQIHKVVGGKVPQVDFKYEKRLHDAYLRVSEEELIDSSIDCSQGGIATALSEICIENNLGAKINIDSINHNCKRHDEMLFSESHGRFLLTSSKNNLDRVMKIFNKYSIPCNQIGELDSNEIIINSNKRNILNVRLDEVKDSYENKISKVMRD